LLSVLDINLLLQQMNNEFEHKIIFFDGFCALCNGSVKWIINRDKNKVFKYAHLQGETAKKQLLMTFDLNYPSSIVLLDRDKIYTKTDATIRIAKELPAPWSGLALFWIIPRPIRNGVYELISKYRYKWFGKYDVCTIPSAEDKDLFLD
jgi:predicted DCC family thiol-disulfide oxidoreductase YuxK